MKKEFKNIFGFIKTKNVFSRAQWFLFYFIVLWVQKKVHKSPISRFQEKERLQELWCNSSENMIDSLKEP